MVDTAMEGGYEIAPEPARHPTGRITGEVLSTGTFVGLAIAVAVAVVTRTPVVAVLAFLGGLTLNRRLRVAAALALVVGVAALRSVAAWHELRPDRLGRFTGWATVVEEPRRYAGTMRV